jgi:plasmid stabilization system protein ParE
MIDAPWQGAARTPGSQVHAIPPYLVHQWGAFAPGAGPVWHGVDHRAGLFDDVGDQSDHAADFLPSIDEVVQENRDIVLLVGLCIAPRATRTTLADLGANAGYRVAGKYKALLDRLYGRLADHPAIGPRRSSLGLRVRIWIVTPYIVIYELNETEDIVTVLGIVHGNCSITPGLLLVP